METQAPKPTIKRTVVKAYYDNDVERNGLKATFEEYCEEVEITHEIIEDIEEWGK